MDGQMFKILLFMKRRPGMSVEDFRSYYESRHVPLCLKYTQGVARYVRRFLDPQIHAETGKNDEMPYDVITELWFDDRAIWEASVAHISTTIMPDEVVADELNVFDRPTMRMATVVECETPMPQT